MDRMTQPINPHNADDDNWYIYTWQDLWNDMCIQVRGGEARVAKLIMEIATKEGMVDRVPDYIRKQLQKKLTEEDQYLERLGL